MQLVVMSTRTKPQDKLVRESSTNSVGKCGRIAVDKQPKTLVKGVYTFSKFLLCGWIW